MWKFKVIVSKFWVVRSLEDIERQHNIIRNLQQQCVDNPKSNDNTVENTKISEKNMSD